MLAFVLLVATQHLDFDDDKVDGDIVKPESDVVDSRGRARHTSLIKLRYNFIPELVKSADDR